MPLKILFVSHSSEFYGAENSLFDILFNLDRNLFEPYLIVPRKGILSIKAQEIGIKIFFVKHKQWVTGKRSAWKQFFYIPFHVISTINVRKIAKHHRIDLVYTNTSTIIHAALAARSLALPHIWHIRESLGTTYVLILGSKILLKVINYLSSKIILNSKNTYNFFKPCNRDKTEIIYNGLDISKKCLKNNISSNDHTLKDQFSLHENDLLVGMVGSINERKNQRDLILAMPIILQLFPNTKLLIIGDNKSDNLYCSEIKNLCNRMHLNEHVVFTGFMEDLRPIYSILNLLVLLSSDEPFGRVLIEAMSFNVPVIATNVGGVNEIINNGINGILIEKRDPFIVANAIIDLLNDKEKSHKLVNAGRETVVMNFDIKKSIVAIQNIIINLCG